MTKFFPRFFLVLLVWLVYVFGFVPAYQLFGISVAAMGAIPLGLTGGLLGIWLGLIVGVLQIPLHWILFGLVTQSAAQTMAQQLPGILLGVFFPILTGWIRNALSESRRQVSQREQVEQDLRESQARYRAIIEDQTELICRFRPDGTLTFVNEAYCRYFGKTRDELLGKSFMPLIPEDDHKYVETQFATLSRETPVITYEHRIIMPDGNLCWQQWTDHALFDDSGNLIEYASVGRDVTERKQAELALHQLNLELEKRVAERTAELSNANADLMREMAERQRAEEQLRQREQLYRTLAEAAQDLIYVINRDDRVEYVNNFAAASLGRTPAEVIGKPRAELFPTDVAESQGEHLRHVFETGEPLSIENHRPFPGRIAWQDTRLVPLKDEMGAIYAVMGVSRDITARKQAEEERRRFKLGIDRSNEAIFMTDPAGNIVYVNPAFERIYGYSKSEALGQTPRILKSGLMGQEFYAQFWDMILDKQVVSGEITNKSKDGRLITVEGSVNPILDTGGELIGFLTIQHDITQRKIAEQALQASEQRYRTHFANVTDVIYSFDLKFRIVTVSPSVERVLGYQPEELLGKQFTELNILAPKSLEAAITDTLEVLNGAAKTSQYEFIAKDGRRVVGEVTGAPLYSENGEIIGLISVARDITARKQAEEQLRASEERYALAARGANDGLWDWNLQTNEIFFSSRWKAMLGYMDTAISSHPNEWFSRVHLEDLRQLQADLDSHLEGHTEHLENEYRIQHADGKYRWVLCRGVAVRDEKGKPLRLAGSQTDITRRKEAEERLTYDALHEPLTGLPNRALFVDRLTHCLKQAKRIKRYLAAVLFLDLDRFKLINDSLGHLVGDELLIAVARRLESCVRPTDTIARFGGDEFAILLEGIHSEEDATRTAERVQTELDVPFHLQGHTLSVTTSIGIALTRDVAGDKTYEHAEELLRDADTAMYRAKGSGKARYELFDPSMHARAIAVLQMEADLRRALERNELVVYYQPVVTLNSRRITSVEALVRWQHPTRGMISPADFVTLAEETGLIIPMGEWILRTACAQTTAWRQAGYTDLQVAVNFSARQLQDTNLPAMIRRVLDETGLQASALQMEITESTAMQDMVLSLRILHELSGFGIHVAIDDFGNSYSAFGNLKRFPFEILKIDRSFVRDIGHDTDTAAIVTAIIAMGRSLKLRVIAEGVEIEEQLNFLQSHQCDGVQGFYFSRAVPAEELSRLLRQ